VEKFPNQPGFRDTRGRILLLLGRDREALTDLELAAAQPDPDAGTVEALATAYKSLKLTQPTDQQLRLWSALISISHSKSAAARAAAALVKEQSETAPPAAAGWWHFLLAADARQAGQTAAVRSHLQTAYQLAPEIPRIANDVALDAAFGRPSDPARALAVIQPVVDKFPDNPDYRGTRGRILLLMGRAREAAADLSWAVGKSKEPSLEIVQALEAANKIINPPKPAPKPLRQPVRPVTVTPIRPSIPTNSQIYTKTNKTSAPFKR
jgi:tetratricopeptide (TPR) repeat protein